MLCGNLQPVEKGSHEAAAYSWVMGRACSKGLQERQSHASAATVLQIVPRYGLGMWCGMGKGALPGPSCSSGSSIFVV